MSTALQLVPAVEVLNRETITSQEVMVPGIATPVKVLNVPWRDPQTVSKEELAIHINSLEKGCIENPHSADLRTCLGMAYAMNLEAYKSMDALESAVALDETHFFAQLKLSELYYRLRALPKAEEETLKALKLAQNAWEMSIARSQLQEIRRLIREGTQKPQWNKPLKNPAIFLGVLMIALSIISVMNK